MENNPFGESSWSSSAESKDDKSEKKKDSASSKTAISLGKVAEQPFFSRNESVPEKRQQTVWERHGEEPKVEESAEMATLPEAGATVRPLDQLRQVIADHREGLAHEQGDLHDAHSEQAAQGLGAEAQSLLLNNTEALTHDQPDVNPDTIMNDAYDQTASQVREAFHPAGHAEDHGSEFEPGAPSPPDFEQVANTETVVPPPLQTGEAGGDNPPPRTPEQPSAAEQPEPQEDPRLHGAVSPSPVAAETVSATTSEQNDWYYAGRRRGTIAGLAVGYFAGRHGERRRAKRKMTAERKRFEKETAALSAALENKEQQIRRLTEEQAETTPPKQYPKVIERLQTAAPLPERPPQSPPPVLEYAAAAPERRVETQQSVEARRPAAETKEPERSTYAEVIPFTKTSAELTWRELKAIAEKIKVDDNLTLEDMYQAKRFDEKAFRRIVSVFLEGGDVRRAITHEVVEHDKNFERDPIFRHKDDAGGIGGGGKVEQAVVQNAKAAPGDDGGSITTPFRQIDGQPEPSPEMIKAIKQRQATSIAVVALLIIALILLVLALSK